MTVISLSSNLSEKNEFLITWITATPSWFTNSLFTHFLNRWINNSINFFRYRLSVVHVLLFARLFVNFYFFISFFFLLPVSFSLVFNSLISMTVGSGRWIYLPICCFIGLVVALNLTMITDEVTLATAPSISQLRGWLIVVADEFIFVDGLVFKPKAWLELNWFDNGLIE